MEENFSTLETAMEVANDVFGVKYSKDYKKLVDAKAHAGKHYAIDDRVEIICDGAFKDCNNLEKIVMPKNLKNIGDEAFYGCSGLSELTLPNSLTKIGDGAFCDCSGLTKLTLPNSLTRIGDGALDGCSGLTELTLPNSLTKIGIYAFRGCTGLGTITVGSGNSRYDSRDNCNSIIDTETNTLIVGCKNSVIPNSITSIGDSAFYDCSELTELTLPNSLTSIGDFAFHGCSGLTELALPNSLTIIGDSAFKDCSGLNELALPNSVTSIGQSAFYGCGGLTELTLPNSLTKIGIYAFKGCTGLETITVGSGNSRYDSRDNCNSIIDTETNTLIVGCKNSVIPDSITSIWDFAFHGCIGLTELTLPNSVTSIETWAFSGCRGLEKITVNRGNNRYDSRDNCNSIIDTETNTLIVGCKNSVIPNSVTSIGNSAFCGCSGLTELTLPNNITSIGFFAFDGCGGLTELTLPDSLKSIEYAALWHCCGLAKIASLAEIPPVCDFEVFEDDNKTNCELIVPEGSVTAYKQAEGWKEFSNIRGFAGNCVE